ncbi:ubiquitin-like protein Pup [Saccharopolyspora shandongensis]|nr:ubiquitin-like protein Pup [Saccharopolyspora shandongensis]
MAALRSRDTCLRPSAHEQPASRSTAKDTLAGRQRMRHEKPQHHGRHDDDELTDPTPTGQDRRDKLEDGTEAMLDEIDDVLEENAAEFVRSYIQKGGE